jgi:multidrug efflux pump subunit AcrB
MKKSRWLMKEDPSFKQEMKNMGRALGGLLLIIVAAVGQFWIRKLIFEKEPTFEIPNESLAHINLYAEWPQHTAAVIEDSLTESLEKDLMGIDGLGEISSISRADRARLSLSFSEAISQVRARNLVEMRIHEIDSSYRKRGITFHIAPDPN